MSSREIYTPTVREYLAARIRGCSDTEIQLLCYSIPEQVTSVLNQIAETSKGAA